MQFCICGFQDHSGPALLLVIKALKKKLGVLAGSNNDVFGSVRVDSDPDPVGHILPKQLNGDEESEEHGGQVMEENSEFIG